MTGDSKNTILDRYYTLLHWQLMAQLPRPGGIHIYSHGALLRGYTSERSVDEKGNAVWKISISNGIDYGASAMGFKEGGGRRSPRGYLERINFKTIDNCTRSIAKIVALPSGGKVVIR